MIYTLGETVFDIIFRKLSPLQANPGGSALNTSVSLGRLGCPVSFISELGNDTISKQIALFLNENNVCTDFINFYKSNQTSLALAFLDDSNNASYDFYKNTPSERELILPNVEENDIVLFSSSFALNKAIRSQFLSFLETAKNKNAILIYDPNIRTKNKQELSKIYNLVMENIELTSIIRGSDEDFASIFNCYKGVDVYKKISNQKVLIYTKNKDGVELHSPKVVISKDSAAITPISTIGAGDNFNAGIIYSLLKHKVTHGQLLNLDSNIFSEILQNGISLATSVCMSMENAISPSFAKSFS